ncbi:hypothetical protein [Peterkaempfera griseoplana]|uniref:hypothetical protein n=1 Tax=Peterkaempfera griseoplana TaxID=66896 RepID=UPI0012FEC7E9|nr:hypothetical protein [Peterkaempfera griseoplana]
MDDRVNMPWFSVGDADDDASATLDAAGRRYVSVLRDRAATWPCDPEETFVLRPEESGFAHLLAVLCLVRAATDVVSHVFGVFFDGQGVLGSELHNQMYTPLGGSRWWGRSMRRVHPAGART